MNTFLKQSLALLALAGMIMACSDERTPTQPTATGSTVALTGSGRQGATTKGNGASPAAGTSANPSSAGNVKGSAGDMPAYYDSTLVTINVLQLADVAGGQVGTNPSHNEIFVTNDLDDEQDFIPVIDAIQGDGFNPLWEQIRIVFNAGVTPHQFFSDDEVHAAAAGSRPEITLVDTHEVYRCSVVGTK
jgi:hypothetical protein